MSDDALELSLVNDLQEIVRAAAEVDAFCEERGLGPQVAYAVNLSVDEILTNTISYGYDDDDEHRIGITLRVSGDALVVVIEDDGREFDSAAERETDMEGSLEERALGGLGLFLVQRMMDEVAYRRSGDRNVITLTKRTTEDG